MASGDFYPQPWQFGYPQTATTAATNVLIPTNQPVLVQPVQPAAPPKPEPEDELAWLRRRVDEVCALVAA